MLLLRRLPALGPLLALPAAPAWAVEGRPSAAPHLDGAELGLLWAMPFIGLLLAIAFGPLFVPRFWHDHFGKVSAGCTLAFLVPFADRFGLDLALYELLHVLLLEYLPFIILLLALFTVTGGIKIDLARPATPALNTGLLATGTCLASLTGTTGAAMVMIRPILRINAQRQRRMHIAVFFIFLVANIGGSLTPLGDPPLFLGFLKGVPFFWPTVHLLLPMAFTAGVLLAVFYALDRHLFSLERRPEPRHRPRRDGPLLDGMVNLPLLAGVLGAVLLSGIWHPGIGIEIYHVRLDLEDLVCDILLLTITWLSWRLTPRATRRANDFTWLPILEVAKLFAGIFITIVPAIAILRAGEHGALAGIIRAVTNEDGTPNNVMYFWATGGLSSFLDNAPTYLVFFNTAGGDPTVLTGPLTTTLVAISAGAVFMGANTYIGNAPNFMVRAVAEEMGVRMPSFFGYMLWSGAILLPVFALLSLLFFV